MTRAEILEALDADVRVWREEFEEAQRALRSLAADASTEARASAVRRVDAGARLLEAANHRRDGAIFVFSRLDP